MNLYIQIKDGQPFQHPAFEDNLIQAFGEIPFDWEPFERLIRPILNPYQFIDEDQTTYVKVNNIWTDSIIINELSNAEKIERQNLIKSHWLNNPNFASWIFNEDTCDFEPPVPRPTELTPDGQMYRWQGSSNNWVLASKIPPDNINKYKWNFITWTWEEFTPSSNP